MNNLFENRRFLTHCLQRTDFNPKRARLLYALFFACKDRLPDNVVDEIIDNKWSGSHYKKNGSMSKIGEDESDRLSMLLLWPHIGTVEYSLLGVRLKKLSHQLLESDSGASSRSSNQAR